MTPERWRRVREVFEEAEDGPTGGRAAFLDAACAGDDGLRAEVESLLGSSDAAGEFLGRPAIERMGTVPGGIPDEPHRRRIGSYEILGEIGHGGMGTVYLAARSDQGYEKQFALKVVRRGMDTDSILRRFEDERRILAGLDHPNIARVLDGGSTEDGLPYFVMEHIEGRHLAEDSEARKRTPRERLLLFQDVCSAVQYAHQHLVVHRDIKPSNILVTPAGVPKLLDFGLAKLLDPSPGESRDRTETALRILTPEYASPEQARGEPVSTASDVYSLGVVLQQLLTGLRPSESGGRRRLDPELENILSMALKSEPERRYASVEQLSGDIGRYLSGMPVRARGDSLSYRARKFAGRHRAAVAAAAGTITLTCLLVAFYTFRLAAERDHARMEARKATEVSGFLTGLFNLSDPDRSKGATVTARELLDRAATRIDKELAKEPDVQAAMMDVIGNVYRQLGMNDKARPLLVKALALRRLRPGRASTDLAASLDSLALALHMSGDYPGARTLYEESLALREQNLGKSHPDVSRTLGGLANVRKQQGDLEGARVLLERAVSIQEKTSPADDPVLAKMLNNLALVYQRLRDTPRAEALLVRALAIHEKNNGPDDPLVGGTLDNLAGVKREGGDLTGARPLQERALAIAEKTYGPEHPAVALSLNSMAGLLQESGDYAGARPLYERAIRIYEKSYGPEHPYVAYPVKNLGNSYVATGDFASALPLYERALAIRRKAFPEEHADIAMSLYNLGNVKTKLGDWAGGEPLLSRALAIQRRVLPPAHLAIAETLFVLGGGRAAHGDPKGAETLLAECLEIRRKAPQPNNELVAEAEAALEKARASSRLHSPRP